MPVSDQLGQPALQHFPNISSFVQLVDEGNKRVVTLEKAGFPDAVSWILRQDAALSTEPFSQGREAAVSKVPILLKVLMRVSVYAVN